MKTSVKHFVLFFTITCIALFATSCADLQDLSTTGIEGFNVSKISQEGLEGEILVKIKNPNKVGFSIYPSEFEITYSGVKLGKAKLNKRVHISANSEKVYSFHLSSNFENINLMELINLFSADKAGFVEVSGDLKAGKLWMKKRYPVHIKERIDLNK